MTSRPTPVLALTVLGDDRPGIVADVTAALAGLGANLEDSTMTLLRGHFAMVVLVRTTAPVADVESALASVGADGSLTVDVRELREPRAAAAPGAAWTLRVHGADRPGIVASITEVLAAHGGNIVDLGTRLDSALYVLVAEVALPTTAEGAAVLADLRAAASAVGVTVAFEPVDDEVL